MTQIPKNSPNSFSHLPLHPSTYLPKLALFRKKTFPPQRYPQTKLPVSVKQWNNNTVLRRYYDGKEPGNIAFHRNLTKLKKIFFKMVVDRPDMCVRIYCSRYKIFFAKGLYPWRTGPGDTPGKAVSSFLKGT